MRRTIDAELLDQLPAEDVRALRSRSDLRRLNRIMNHAGILEGLLRRGMRPTARRADAPASAGPPARWFGKGINPAGIEREYERDSPCRSNPGAETLADLGAGDGSMALRLVQRLNGGFAFGCVCLVDRNSVVSPETRSAFRVAGAELEVVKADVFAWLRQTKSVTVVLANLFLHHFSFEDLGAMFELIATRAQVFAACEPRRGWAGAVASRALGLIGCNAVTRHDARVSVRAGFAGRELSSLWPQPAGWDLHEGRAGLFSHGFLARRRVTSGAEE